MSFRFRNSSLPKSRGKRDPSARFKTGCLLAVGKMGVSGDPGTDVTVEGFDRHMTMIGRISVQAPEEIIGKQTVSFCGIYLRLLFEAGGRQHDHRRGYGNDPPDEHRTTRKEDGTGTRTGKTGVQKNQSPSSARSGEFFV